MTTSLTGESRTTARPRGGGDVARGLFRLSKIFVYQNYFGWGMAWLTLSPQARDRPGTTAAMLLFLLGSMGIVTCTCATDDLVGFRNGSDARNYKSGETKRDIRGKPLLSGAVTEREAVRFIVCAASVAVLAGIGAFWALDWRAPAAAYLLYGVGFFFSVQYSAGLRLSYHRGGAETLLCLATTAGLLAPYLAVERHWSSPAVLAGLLLGLWLVMVSSYSNVNDADGDRSVGRRTLAASTGPRVYKTAMVLLVLASATLICLLGLATPWPWWTLLTLLPATVLHTAQLREGPLRGRWLSARKLGLYAYDLGFLGLLAPALYVLS
ncbi:UbiA family prenyltransferase [Streptomyces malaysiensis]|uniref:UbiA family prenyltransferase n=1 Tax=Streptomyces malaysiensis subsp. samsunensis TaxID=459658 RepID=A0A9X2RV72_STRMQ|nr:UbiA family prenyltransferase [Streptomyces samsunensis]MCQ8831643.1 UbiA family prenyltransferase [Streptomyces samsunensis]